MMSSLRIQGLVFRAAGCRVRGSRLSSLGSKDLALRGQEFFASSAEGDSSRCGGLQVYERTRRLVSDLYLVSVLLMKCHVMQHY